MLPLSILSQNGPTVAPCVLSCKKLCFLSRTYPILAPILHLYPHQLLQGVPIPDSDLVEHRLHIFRLRLVGGNVALGEAEAFHVALVLLRVRSPKAIKNGSRYNMEMYRLLIGVCG